MGKTIRFNENGLIAIKKRLNEIMVGTDGVSHNDVCGNVKLYHGTDILALVAILKTNRMCASEGRQHGETHGLNWFSLKNDGSFNKGACFSIEVPENELNNVFQKMNSVHVISRESCLDISRYNPQVEYFCGHTRETLNNYYNIITKKGEKYPIEQIRDEIFYRWCEESGNEETFMSVGDYDFGIIMANILGDDAVRKEGFIDEGVDDEFAPVAEIGMEQGGGPGLYAHKKEIDESYNTPAKADIDRIDYIDYVPHDNPREEGYDETNITEFEPHYDLECYDVQGELIFCDDLTLNELFDYFPDRIIHMMSNKEGRRVSQSQLRIEDILSWNTKPNNIDDVEEVNSIAKRIQPGGPSAYLLTDGEMVSFPDHMQITSIDGMTPSKFVGLGNVRVGQGGIEIAKMPTDAQIRAIKDIARKNSNFYIDIVQDGGKFYPDGICCAVYKPSNPTRIVNDIIHYFQDGVRPQSVMTYESKKRWRTIVENLEPEVSSSEVDLSSFKKRDTLPPGIWKDEETLDSRVRLKLLDIADDFWEYLNLSWVEPKGIIITGSICNFNWSKFSDIDLHIIADFKEIDEKTEFVKQYLDSKKNEWNNEHEGLKIMGFPVELYVQDVNDTIEAGGIYDLEENAWVRKPNPHSIKSIGLNKFSIKDKAAEIMTIIDDMYGKLSTTTDDHEIDQIGEDAHYLWDKVKDLRKKSLNKNGESGSGNIVYKVLRRTGYLDKLFKLFSTVYDRSNSITESIGYDGDIFELAKKHFGTTHDIRECGYVLPDGTMLDFSGRHTLNPGTDSSHLKGRRGIDHREIYEIGWDETGNVKNFDYTMEDFIKAGAIRVHVTSKYSSINLYKKPTTYQIPVLISIIQYAKGCVDVEIGDGDESLSYAEYEGVKARKPIADILRYFDEGINLVSESKEVLKEFLEKDHNIFLYTYFQWAEKASDRDKVEDLFYHCPYIMSEYLSDVSGYDEELSNLEDELTNDSDLEYDDEFIERLLDALERHNLLRELLNNPYKYAYAEELPAWFTMDFIRVVKNEWCIHFTEDADSIAKNGFTGGTEEIGNLAYTGAGRQKRGEGYDFAFLLGDSGVDFNNYGSEAVIFRTSGVLLLHYGDEQRQVVFWGPNVKSFIPVVRNYGDWVVYGNKGQILMSTSNPSEIADWATNNLPQYRKQIMTGKNGYIPKRSVFDKEKNKYAREPYPIYKNESVKKYLTLLKEEVALDGSTEDNPYEKRWKAEREALKSFVANYGKLMQSKEDNKGGKLYKVYYDETMSNLIGYNYCICVQWNEQEMKPGSTVYIRALDKFTPFIRRNLQFDTRGRDNMRGTYDDTGY